MSGLQRKIMDKYSPLTMDRCANCGCKPVIIFNGFSLYDGEGVCSKECLAVHDALGCPLESIPPKYRECPH